VSTSAAAAVPETACTIATCRNTCALEVVDSLLQATGSVRGEEVDALLDLRWLLHRRDDAEAALALFCQLRRSMESRHYLAFYRLRRWLENHLLVSVRVANSTEPRSARVRLDRYCIEAVRCHCMSTVVQTQERASARRARFLFRPAAAVRESPAISTAAA
jgi:hypothetical protein